MKNLFAIFLSILVTASLANSQTIPTFAGTIEECFIGGNTEFYNIFHSKLKYPESLRREKVTGIVFYEIEIDTTGHILWVKILRGVTPLMDQEVESKIWLTDGKWKPFLDNGMKVNYRIIDKVYFELR